MRTYTEFSTEADRALLSVLADTATPADAYQDALRALGGCLADVLVSRFGDALPRRLCIVVTVEDADSLGAGMIARLESKGLGDRIRLVCFWNGRIEINGMSLAPILKEYREPCNVGDSALVVVKSIISSGCVVRTNLTRLIEHSMPQRIFVVAPVMFAGADAALRHDFPAAIAERFEYITLAIDDEKLGNMVVPGVGGDIYTRMGYGGAVRKNHHIPNLIKARRRHPALVA